MSSSYSSCRVQPSAGRPKQSNKQTNHFPSQTRSRKSVEYHKNQQKNSMKSDYAISSPPNSSNSYKICFHCKAKMAASLLPSHLIVCSARGGGRRAVVSQVLSVGPFQKKILDTDFSQTPVGSIVSQSYAHAHRELTQTFCDYINASELNTANIFQYSVKLNDLSVLQVGTQTPASQIVSTKFYAMNRAITDANRNPTPLLVAFGLPAFQGDPSVSRNSVTVATRSTIIMPSTNPAWQLIGDWNENTIAENTAILHEKEVAGDRFVILGTYGFYDAATGGEFTDGSGSVDIPIKVEYKVRQTYPNAVNRTTNIYAGLDQAAYSENFFAEASESTPHLVTAVGVTKIE